MRWSEQKHRKQYGSIRLFGQMVWLSLWLTISAGNLYSQTQNTSWNGSQSSNWFEEVNWSKGVPGSNGHATIGWINPNNHQPVLDGTTTIGQLTLGSNPSTLTIAPGSVLEISGNASTGNSSTLVSNGAQITIGGNFSGGGTHQINHTEFNVQGSFSVGNAQDFLLNGGTLNIYSSSSLGGNLIVDQGGVVNVYDNFTISASSNLTILDGEINFFGNAVVSGAGNFNLENGTVNFESNSTFDGSGSFNIQSGDVNFNGNSTFGGNADVNAGGGNLYFSQEVNIVASGSFNAQESTITMDGATWTMVGGASFDPGTSTVIFSGDSQLITGGGGINEITFYNLEILDDANVQSDLNVIVLNDMTVDAGAGFETTDDSVTINVIGEVIGDPFIDAERPYLISITSLNEQTILLRFNQELQAASAENTANYQVENQPNPTQAVLGGTNNEEVTLTLGFTMQNDTQYFLVINNLQNLQGGTISTDHRKRFGITTPAIDLGAANQALEDASEALEDYLGAGGSDDDTVYTDVEAAVTALEAAINAEPQVQEDIDQATSALQEAIDALEAATGDLISDLLSDAASALDQAAGAQSDYLDAGGSDTDEVYTLVGAAADALQAALDADPFDAGAVAEAISDLQDAISALEDATEALANDLIAAANAAIDAASDPLADYLLAGGNDNDEVYTDVQAAISALESARDDEPIDADAVNEAIGALNDAVDALEDATAALISTLLANANDALDAATPAQNDYVEAGGDTQASVYTQVTQAANTLQNLMNAEPADYLAIIQATQALNNAIDSLNEVTELLQQDVVAAAEGLLLDAQDAMDEYLLVEGDPDAAVFTQVNNEATNLQALLDADPQDHEAIRQANVALLAAINALIAETQAIKQGIETDAAEALLAATAAREAYQEALGDTQATLYTAVVDAAQALQDALEEDPLDHVQLMALTVALLDHITALENETTSLVSALVADAQDAIAAAETLMGQYLDMGGETTDAVYADTEAAIGALQATLQAEPLDVTALINETNALLDATNGLDTALAALHVPSPANTTASVGAGMAGEATPITITVRNTKDLPLPGHASDLSVSIGGANDGATTSSVTDQQDGSYLISYTPTVKGQDLLDIRLDGVAIQGSPYTSNVAAGYPASLTLLQQPTAGMAGEPLSPAPQVEVRDAFNNLVEGATVYAVINKNDFCGGCTTEVATDANGLAVFNNLVINVADAGYEIRFRAQGSEQDIFSTHFTLNLQPNTPATAVIISGPTTTKPGELSCSYFTLTLTDAFGNESYFIQDTWFTLSSTSSSVEFVPFGGNPDNPTNQLLIEGGVSSNKFRYCDWEPGFQIISANISSQKADHVDDHIREESIGPNNKSGQKSFTPGFFEIEVTGDWVWVAREGNGQDDDWKNSENWNMTEGSPQDGDVVILRSFHADIPPRINGVAQLELERLIVQGDLAVSLEPLTSVTVNEVLNLNPAAKKGGNRQPILRIKSNATGTASFITNSAGVDAQVQRFVNGASRAWNQLASPVVGQSIAGAQKNMDPAAKDFAEGSLFTWFEPAQQWVSYRNNSVWPTWADANAQSQAFIPGRGYLAAYDDNPTLEFEGTLNHGSYDITLRRSAHPDDPYAGFNMIGNPYSAAINWDQAMQLEGNSSVLASQTIWIWNNEEGQYGTYNPNAKSGQGTHGVTRYINPMQGFWVRASSNAQQLRLTNDMRTHAPDPGAKNQQPLQHEQTLRITLSGAANNYRDQVIIEFGHAQNGGAQKMFSMISQAPSLYVQQNEKAYSIAFLTREQASVPLAFKAGVEDEFSIRFEGTQHFDYLLLEDLISGQMHDLTKDPVYSFRGSPNDLNERFVLHTGTANDPTQVIDREQAHSELNAYVSNQILYVHTPEAQTQIALYDIQGRRIMEQQVHSRGLHRFPLQLPTGVYIVRSVSGTQIASKKIIIQYNK